MAREACRAAARLRILAGQGALLCLMRLNFISVAAAVAGLVYESDGMLARVFVGQKRSV